MKNLTCIMCPKGCRLTVDEENGYAVSGNSCEKGAEYGVKELTDPQRVVTSTVMLKSRSAVRLPVKTSDTIPKKLMSEAMKLLDGVTVTAPVKCGDVIIENILGTGVNFISSKTVE